MKPVWVEHYIEGIPAKIDTEEYDSLVHIFETRCAEFSHKPALSNLGHKMTYQELDQLSRQFAAWLQQDFGIKKGDRVALMMPNLLQYPVAMFGILRAGGIIVNVNPMYSPRELEHQLKDSGARAIVILENFAHILEKVIDKVDIDQVVITRIGDMFPFPKSGVINFMVKTIKHMVPEWHLPGFVHFKTTLSKGKHLSLQPVSIKLDDIAFLQYTGGTTGVSKGVILTHGNILANILQSSCWVSPLVNSQEDVKMIAALPLYHIFALTIALMLPLNVGGESILITNPRDFRGFINLIKNIKFTNIIGVNTLFNAMLKTKGIEEVDFSALTCTVGGGMATQEDVARRWHERTGCPIAQGYGLSETSPVATMNPVNLKTFSTSSGLPVSNTEVAIMDEQGNELPLGEDGEICIRGPQVTQGYWNRPQESEEVFFPGNWFRSGDIGHMDENGYLTVGDRMKDMILVSGFNVYPNEVEDVLTLHPDICEAAVVGIPDDEKGEVVKAYIVKQSPALTEAEVIRFCRENLAAYKIPKQVEFTDDLPKTNVGKVLRRALRDGAGNNQVPAGNYQNVSTEV